jgi:hypothetical protein
MVTPDRIRLTGLLRKALQMRGFLFPASPVHHGGDLGRISNVGCIKRERRETMTRAIGMAGRSL